MELGEGISGAVFSQDRKHRFSLWRVWDRDKGLVLFVGLNPSTASHIKDDPTIRRLVGFAKTFGFGGLFVGNLFSLVSPNPERLKDILSLADEANDGAIKRMREMSTLALVGWGEWGRNAGLRPEEVLSLVGEPVYCLKINKSGEPSHPLYLPTNTKLMRYYRK